MLNGGCNTASFYLTRNPCDLSLAKLTAEDKHPTHRDILCGTDVVIFDGPISDSHDEGHQVG